MTGKVIALVDASIYAKSVCDHAAWIAGRTGLSVELMHVLGRREVGSSADLSGAIALGARTALLDELATLDEQRSKLIVHRGRAILDDAKAMMDEAGVEASVHLRHGDLVEAILAKESEAEMILVGKRGEAADFAKGHLGSNLERVMRTAQRPLFIASRAFRPIERFLIGYDGSASAVRAVNYVAANPLYRGLAATVVTIGPASDSAKDGLRNVEATLAAAGIAAESKIVPGHPEEALAELVEATPYNHLVLGASGHSRLRTLFVGSTTLETIRNCKVPILMVR